MIPEDNETFQDFEGKIDWSNINFDYIKNLLHKVQNNKIAQEQESAEKKPANMEQSKKVFPTRPNKIEIVRSEYRQNDKEDEDLLLNDVKDLIRILLKNKYQIKVFDDDYAIVIEFDYDDPLFKDHELTWVEID